MGPDCRHLIVQGVLAALVACLAFALTRSLPAACLAAVLCLSAAAAVAWADRGVSP